MGFPERLKSLILEKGMDVKTFVADFRSKNLGVSVSNSTMSNLLRGKTECNYSTIIAFAKYFNVTTDYLLGMTDTRSADIDLKQACEKIGLNTDLIEGLKIICDNIPDQSYKIYISTINMLLMDYVAKFVWYAQGIDTFANSYFPDRTILHCLWRVFESITYEWSHKHDFNHPENWTEYEVKFGNMQVTINIEDIRHKFENDINSAFWAFRAMTLMPDDEVKHYRKIADEVKEDMDKANYREGTFKESSREWNSAIKNVESLYEDAKKYGMNLSRDKETTEKK